VWLRALADSLRNGLAERVRPAIAWRRSGNWGRDTERAVRRLVRAPVFTLSMVGTLTIGLGAFAMVYTVVQKVLVAPLPYDRPDDLYFVWRNYTWIDLDRGWLGGTDVAAMDSAGGAIEGAVGLRRRTVTLAAGGAGEPREIALMVSTSDLFTLLGAEPIIGRGFAAGEAGPGRPAVMVLGYDLWRDRFGADPTIVGRQVRADDEPYTVIGVMGPDFHFARHSSLGPPEQADAYVTFDYDLAGTSPGNGAFAGLLRARPGATPQAVAAAVNAVGTMVDRRDMRSRGLRLYPVGMKEDLVSAVRPALVVLGLAGAFLVLVLAVNLAALLLMRAAQRERELAISRALGANPMALAWATLAEGGLLGLLGGVGGTLLATWGTRLLVALAPLDLPRRESISVDWGVAAVVTAVGLVLGLAAAAPPAFWAARSRLDALLRSVAVRGGGGHGRMRRAMVVVQVALSLVLLTAGGLVARSFERLLRTDPGFEPAGVLTLRIPVPTTRYTDEAQANVLHARLQRELAALPGVTAVGAASVLPLTSDADQGSVRFPGAPGNTGTEEVDNPLVDVVTTRAGYLAAMDIPVLAGRGFASERPTGVREALIDRTLAARFFPNSDAVGATLLFDEDTLRVVGVVEHARLYDLHADGRSQVYVRNEDYTYPTLSWAVRTTRTPTSLVPEVRAAVHRADPQLAMADVQPMQRVVDESLRQQRLSAVLIGGFSLGALLLAAMGLFGVVSGAVTRRRHELAVRLALGADHGRVLRLVLREGALLVALGVLVGVPGIYLAGRALAGVLVGVSPFDAPTLVAVAVGLSAVALAACYIPARRVAGIEPARAFREE
jgi:putative ABC transport system permease protein